MSEAPRHDRPTDQEIVAAHALGERCDGCGTVGGCVTLAAAVRRRTAAPPWGSRVVEILLGGTVPR